MSNLGADPSKTTAKEFFTKFTLEASTIDLIGHAIALNVNDEYVGIVYNEGYLISSLSVTWTKLQV